MTGILSKIVNKNLYVGGLFVVFIAICYTNVVNGPLLFDDEHFIEKNLMVHNLSNIPEIYTTSVTEGAYLGGNFYRPNQQVVYAVIYHFFKLNPVPYHIVSLIFHFLVSFLIFLLLIRFNISRVAAFLASLLYLVHPIQTESVSYISGLAGPMGYTFTLAGLLMFYKSLQSNCNKRFWTYNGISIVLFAIALFTKENQVIFFPLSVLLLIYYWVKNKKKPGLAVVLVSVFFMMMAIGYLMLKFTVFQFTETAGLTGHSNAYTESLLMRVITFASVQWDYARMIVFPYHLNYEKPYLAYASWLTVRSVFGYLLFASAIYFLIRMRKYPNVFLGVAWYFVAMAPFSGIIPLNAMFLEHWLYTPLVGVLILLATMFDKLLYLKRANLVLGAVGIVVVLFCIRGILRNEEWSDIEKFYLNELKYTDSSIRIYNNLGMYYAEKEDDAKCIYYYQKAIEAGDLYAQPHHNLANLYHKRGEVDKAIMELYNGLRIDPNFIYSLNKLFLIYRELNEYEKAERVRRLVLNVQNGYGNNINEIQDIIFN